MSQRVGRVVEEEEEVEVKRSGDGCWDGGWDGGGGSGRVGGGVDGSEGWEENGWFWEGKRSEDGLDSEEDWGDGYGETV